MSATMNQLEVTTGVFKMTAEPLEGGQGFGFALEVREDEQWRRISAPGNPLVCGNTLRIHPDKVIGENGKLVISGTRKWRHQDGGDGEYVYSGTIAPVGEWLRVDLTIESSDSIPLEMKDGFEPELTWDMGALPPYERGDHVWFKLAILNPTRWNDEAFGNDFPATYYYDPYGHYELSAFYDMTAMSWMSFENIARFMNYRFGFRRRYQPEPAFEIGMFADGFSGKIFPAGKQSIRYFIKAAPRRDSPTEQDALVRLVDECLPLLPPDTPWPENATSWEDFSQKCTADLMAPNCWGSDEKREFILNYVDGYSPEWKEAMAARGFPCNFKSLPCVDSAAWVAHPLGIVAALGKEEAYDALLDRILGFLVPHLYEGNLLQDGNHQPVKSQAAGTWQYFYILEELWQISRITGDARLEKRLRDRIDTVMIGLAREVGYVFPLSFCRATLTKLNNGDGHAITGIYASLMLDLYEAHGVECYLDEAERSLRVLYNLPVNVLSQESFLLAMAVQAADRMALHRSPEYFRKARDYFLAQTLRMLHWFEDRTTENCRDVSVLGMFQACATILYPAFYENIENLARIAPVLKHMEDSPDLYNVFNLARKTNFYFFQRCLPEKYRVSPLDYIPHENVPILEGPQMTTIGQEIYGAGWTFRAYLMWEAFARATDREIMVLNLNSFEEQKFLGRNDFEVEIAIFNPGDGPRSVELEFPLCSSGWKVTPQSMGSPLNLAPREIRRMKLLYERT